MEKYQARQNDQDRAAEIIAGNTTIEWHPANPTWGDLTPADLVALTSQVAKVIGFKPDHAKGVKVIFGDHHGFTKPLFFSHINSAFCAGIFFFGTDQYIHCEVVINRSLELAENANNNARKNNRGPAQEFSSAGILDEAIPQEQIKCRFDTVLECVTWLIAEELGHAKIIFTAGSESVLEQWQKNYTEMLLGKGIRHDRVYAVKLDEVAVSRIAIRVLESLSQSEDRKRYFRELYQQSLTKTRHIVPLINRNFFVPTG